MNTFKKSRNSVAKKFAAAVAGVATVLTMSAGIVPAASAQTTAELQAQIAGLLATIQGLQGQLATMQGGSTTGGSMMMTSAPMAPLTMGSKGMEVTKLQEWLISQGYSIPAGATGYFGTQTQAAVKAYQEANGITPAMGYYGPITAASITAMMGTTVGTGTTPPPPMMTYPAGCTSSMGYSTTTGMPCSTAMTYPAGCTSAIGYSSTTGMSCATGTTTTTTTTGTVVMDGTDGSLTIGSSAMVSSGQSVKKGETKNVLSTKLQATGGPVTINRVDVRFSERPWLTMTKVVLKDGSGTVIATKMLNGSSDATEVTVGSAYDVRIEGFNYTVTPGTDLHLVVEVTVLASSDKITGQTITMSIPSNGIRTMNGKGYTDSIGGSASFTFTLPTTGSAANIFTRISPTSPAARIVTVSSSQITEDVILGVFGVKSENQNATINTLNFNFNIGSSSAVATTSIFSDVKICDGSTCYGANSLAAGSNNFTNLTIPLTQDVWKDLTLKADVAVSNMSSTALASTTLVASQIAGIDTNFNSLVVTGASNVTSNDTTFLVTGLNLTSPTAVVGSAITQNNTTTGYNVTYSFTLTNTSNSDAYVSRNTFTMLSTSTTGTLGSSTLTTVTPLPDQYAGDNISSTAYVIPAGASRTFTFTGAIRGTANNTVTLQVTAINFGSSATTPTGSVINFGISALKLTQSF